MSDKLQLQISGARKSGKTTILSICEKALKDAGYNCYNNPCSPPGTEILVIREKVIVQDAVAQIEYHRQEIARLCNSLGII
jgi:hypothetical protein